MPGAKIPENRPVCASHRSVARNDPSLISCPSCDHNTKVIYSRLSKGKDAIVRQRECPSCGRRFTTYSRLKPLQLMVLKKDGTREPFDRAKLHASLATACAKRVPEEEIEFMVDKIEAGLREQRRHEVTSGLLEDIALLRLRRVDMVAYLRFRSVYRQDANMDQFQENFDRVD